MTLYTDRLLLVSAGFPVFDAMVRQDWSELSALLGGVDFAEHWAHFPEALGWMRDHLLEHPEEQDWWAYCIIHKNDVRLIGTAGFKGFPDPEGYMEIGYEIADGYQRQGLATEAASALVRYALATTGVAGVRAHTLAQENPSARILRKLGFQFVQEKYDIEDGWIWEWKKEKNR